MKSFTSPLQTHKKELNSKEHLTPKLLPTPPSTIAPIILRKESLSESGGQQSQRCSMKKLCDIYLQVVGTKNSCEFHAKDLILNTNIKQRRVYDLMNILQGCGYVKRISKGKYQSFNFEETQQLPQHGEINVQETSLSSMSFQVKKLLIQSGEFKTFKNICSEVFGVHTTKSLNFESLKRRIYECCKVLKVLGLVEKDGTSFKWKNKYVPPIVERTELKQKEKSRKARNKKKQKKIQTQWQLAQINSILDKVENQKELQAFVQALRSEFEARRSLIPVKRQLKYD